MKEKTKSIIGVCFLLLIVLVVGMLIQKFISRPYIKITTLEKAYHNDLEENSEFTIEYGYMANFPIQNLYVEWIFDTDCFHTDKTYREENIYEVGNPINSFWHFDVRSNISSRCFGEQTIFMRLIGQGLKDSKEIKVNVVPENSYYCKKCQDVCNGN